MGHRVHPESLWQVVQAPPPAGSVFLIATAAQASLLPYFPTIMEHLQKFLVTGHDDLQPVRIQSLGEEGAPRQGFQCQERASAHLLFIETSPGAA